jgi:hypothetical protein
MSQTVWVWLGACVVVPALVYVLVRVAARSVPGSAGRPVRSADERDRQRATAQRDLARALVDTTARLFADGHLHAASTLERYATLCEWRAADNVRHALPAPGR